MKNKQVSIMYGISAIQVLGMAGIAAGKQAGIAIVASGTVILFGCATGVLVKDRKYMTCPECKTSIPKKSRICPECGHRYREGIPENKLTEFINQEKEREMTSEEIDCDFEKIESIAIDEMTAYDGDIEEFLKKRCREEDIS